MTTAIMGITTIITTTIMRRRSRISLSGTAAG
jgi:hypothetical protein